MSQPTSQQASQPQSDQQMQTPPPAMERAEVLVDAFGRRLGEWTNGLGDSLRRFWARTREEGEDIWAEAQDIRSHNAAGSGPAEVETSGSSSNAAYPAQ